MVHHTSVTSDDIQIHNVETIKDELNKYFTVESMGTFNSRKCSSCLSTINVDNISIKEEKELDLIKEGLNYDATSHSWSVEYPWIKPPECLPNTFIAAFGQLKSLEKRLRNSSENHLKLYCDGITDMLNRKVARKLTEYEIATYHGPILYISHHSVVKASPISTPLRIVFNSSSTFMGHQLNDYWAKGPDVLNLLIGVLLRFRKDYIGINGDISKMFNSVKLEGLEQHTHRFL